MIFGLISRIRYSGIEQSLKQANPTGKAFEFSIGDRRGFFFHSVPNKFNKLTYCDENKLVLCDGIPIRRSSAGNYSIIGTLDERDVGEGIDHLVNAIVSNVNLIYFLVSENKTDIIISSNRASAGKMYYRPLEDGISFSSDFTQLLRFGELNINDKGVYAIIRYGACPAPLTISREIHAVPPSHYAVFDIYGKHIKTRPYFQFDFPETNGSDLKPVFSRLHSSTRILNDLGASILMSGGIDSTVLAYKMSQHLDREIRAYHLNFGDKDSNLPFAREAANKTGCRLDIFTMRNDVVADTIMEVAHAYTHPFNDYSTIPTYYLMKCADSCEDETLLIDGTGGDECFGELINPSIAWRLKLAFALPRFVKSAIFNINAYLDPLGTINKRSMIPWKLADCQTRDINSVFRTACPWITLFKSNTKEFEEEIGGNLVNVYTNMIASSLWNKSYWARETVAALCHTSCGLWGAKTHNVKTFSNVQVTYPFMWKDMLEEQGKLSWSTKTSKGIRKRPLKILLEERFPADFIYRKKSGFTPPFETWFSGPKVYELLQDTLLSQHTITESVIDKMRLKVLLQRLPLSTNWPGMLCSFLWGAMFTELWVKANRWS